MVLVEFELENGSSIYMEVDEKLPMPETDDRISLSDHLAVGAKKKFEESLDAIQPIAKAVINKVQNLAKPADEVEVTFGIKMSAELGAVVASGNAEVNYEITLKWNKPSAPEEVSKFD